MTKNTTASATTTTMSAYTTDQIHYHATMIMRLQHDASTGEYFSIYGQYANPDLVGTRRIVSVGDVIKGIERMSRDCSQYGCD
jgi:hypothetical protein